MAQGSGTGGALALGRYELKVELAKSQLGSLWIARPTGDEGGPEWVCVRRIRTGPPLSAEDAQRLSEAAHAALQVRHPGLLAVLDVVVTPQEIGLVSEYVEGEPVRSVLRLPSFRRKPFSTKVATHFALEVLAALEAAQENPAFAAAPLGGTVSPDSVIFDADGGVRLTDLGIAGVLKTIPHVASHPDLASYASPEQLAFASQLDARSEIFALGVLLWELMSGRRLFVAATHAAVAEKVQSGDIGRLDASRPFGGEAIPEPLADIVARALEREPNARFASFGEMRAALSALNPAWLGTRDDLRARIQELSGMTLAARRAALATSLSEPAHADASGASRPGNLLSSAPPKARRSAHKHTLLGVAPPSIAQAGAGRPVSGPANTPPEAPVNAVAASAASLIPSVRPPPPPRSPTLLGVAPPSTPPPPLTALESAATMGGYQGLLDPPKDENGEVVASHEQRFRELMESRAADSAPVPSLESPSAFDFMADRHDDNMATVRRESAPPASSDVGLENATRPLGTSSHPLYAPPTAAEPIAPAASAPVPATAVFEQPPLPPPPPPALEARPVFHAEAARDFPPPPLDDARRQKLRRVVAVAIAATAALLICGLVIAGIRRHKDESSEATSEPVNSSASSAALVAADLPPAVPTPSAKPAEAHAAAPPQSASPSASAAQPEQGQTATPVQKSTLSAPTAKIASSAHTLSAKPAVSHKATPKKTVVSKKAAAAKKAAAKKAAAKKASKRTGKSTRQAQTSTKKKTN